MPGALVEPISGSIRFHSRRGDRCSTAAGPTRIRSRNTYYVNDLTDFQANFPEHSGAFGALPAARAELQTVSVAKIGFSAVPTDHSDVVDPKLRGTRGLPSHHDPVPRSDRSWERAGDGLFDRRRMKHAIGTVGLAWGSQQKCHEPAGCERVIDRGKDVAFLDCGFQGE